jgi:protein-S-isoprenylcysteine O-methyltransferase Ste14
MQPRSLLVFLTDVGMALFLGLFLWVSIESFLSLGNPVDLLTAFNESIYVVFYLVRSRAIASSVSPMDWAIALSSTFLPILSRPAPGISIILGSVLVIVGTLLNIGATTYLGKSIGIVPAERKIKTGGLYKIIRHPMYASGILILVGYFFTNSSLANALISMSTSMLLFVRTEREERFLGRNLIYQNYRKHTVWKLFPFIF